MQVDNAVTLDKKLSAAGRSLAPLLGGNLVDAVWGASRPPPPTAQMRVHRIEHAGECAADKVQRMRREMAGARPLAHLAAYSIIIGHYYLPSTQALHHAVLYECAGR